MARRRKKLVSARTQSVDALFNTESFTLDYYQREYVWEKQQIARLVNDLSRKFLAQWSEEHSLQDVSSYDPYFLGPYIVCTANGRTLPGRRSATDRHASAPVDLSASASGRDAESEQQSR